VGLRSAAKRWGLAVAAAATLLAGGGGPAFARDDLPAGLPTGVYALDPSRSNLTATIHALGFAPYDVTFGRMEGKVDYDPQRRAATSVAIRVDPLSLSNPESAMGRHLLGMLEPQRFPVIAFTSDALVPRNGQTWLVGDLTLHGVTRRVRLALTFQGLESPQAGDPARLAFSGSGQIRRSDFGMRAMRGFVRDQVDLQFDVEFRPREAAGAP
jgi:polyisoprenoid-binding protein YceI